MAAMERVRDYHRHAAECVLLAEQVRDLETKAKLLAMAQAWSRLADLAERNVHTDIVYEYAPRRPISRGDGGVSPTG
jgi:hypothetical protein